MSDVPARDCESSSVSPTAVWLRRLGLLCLVVLVMCVGWTHLNRAEFGAPHPCGYSSDEYDVISRSVKMLSGDLLPIHASKPTAYNLAVAAVFGADYAWQRVMHGMTTAQFEREFFLNGYHFTYLARLVSVASTLGMLILLAWGVRRRGRFAQIFAVSVSGLLMFVTFNYGHWAKEDAFAAFWLTASMVAAAEMAGFSAATSRRRLLLTLGVSAACAGMAISTKYNALPVVLFPLLSAGRLFFHRRADRWLLVVTALVPIVAAFWVGTPFALLHPWEFVHRSLNSAVAQQAAGGFLYVHNIGKTDMAFVQHLFRAENWHYAWLFAALPLLFVYRKGLIAEWIGFLYIAAYCLMLCLSHQLDYQYMLMLTPAVVFTFAGILFSVKTWSKPYWGAIVLCSVIGGALVMGRDYSPSLPIERGWRGTAARQTEEGKQLTERYDTLVSADNRDKPMLIISPFFFRYWPWVPLDSATYTRLHEASRAAGADGGWFERAAKWADTDMSRKFSVDFLEVKTSFKVTPDGTREFAPQPFSLNADDYVGKYSLIVIPATTMELVAKRLPEMGAFNDFIDELIRRYPEAQPPVCYSDKSVCLENTRVMIAR